MQIMLMSLFYYHTPVTISINTKSGYKCASRVESCGLIWDICECTCVYFTI